MWTSLEGHYSVYQIGNETKITITLNAFYVSAVILMILHVLRPHLVLKTTCKVCNIIPF